MNQTAFYVFFNFLIKVELYFKCACIQHIQYLLLYLKICGISQVWLFYLPQIYQIYNNVDFAASEY